MPEKMSKKSRRKRGSYSAEYKAEVVRLCNQADKTPFAVARELGLTPSMVTRWVKQAEIDRSGGTAGPLTSAEREELAALRRENRQLRQEREILRKATAFFAREGTS